MFDYSVAIRTLGKAGEKYQRLLNSLVSQTIPPREIYVYIAEGYPLPKETVGREKYVYVPKGMVAQRAHDHNEINSEWCLFCDDDVEFEKDAVETMSRLLLENDADVISPDTFPHHTLPFTVKLGMALLGSCTPHFSNRGYWVTSRGTSSYKLHPKKETYFSNTNAGPCFLCRTEAFRRIRFQDELWLDEVGYAFPEDKVMFYKMHLMGLRVLTWYNPGVTHLDAGTSKHGNDAKMEKILYSSIRNDKIFCYRFVYPNQRIVSRLIRQIVKLPFGFINGLSYIRMSVKHRRNYFRIYCSATKNAKSVAKIVGAFKSADYSQNNS